MNDIESVIFDMDGVVFDTEKIYLKLWQKVFKDYGYNMKKEVYTSIMGRGRKNAINIFIKEYGKDLPILDMYKQKDEILADFINKNEIPLKTGINELLIFLKQSGYKIALATSSNRKRTQTYLNKSKIENVFDEIICGDEVENSKPNPEIFLKAAKKLNTKYENCLVIEDSQAGLEAAHKAGMNAINVVDLKEPDNNTSKYANEIFENLLDLKKYIVNITKVPIV